MPPAAPKSRRPLLLALLLLLIAALLVHYRARFHFDLPVFRQQLRHANPAHILAGVLLIYSTFWLRSLRWAVLIAPARRVPPFSLTGSQFIGFTAVSLFGRLADLTRPYLIARRTNLPLASQVAVYTIERMFDLGAAAVLFSCALAVTPRGAPHHVLFVRAGILSLAGTAFLACFALLVRHFGESIAALSQNLLGRLSKPVANALAQRILTFRGGLSELATGRQVLAATAISLILWTLVAESYVQTVHSFPQTSELATLPFSRVMLLMAASMGGSLLQLPIVGWFTQVAVTAAAMHTLYGAPLEAATACGAVLLFINTLSIIPIGLLYTRLERVSLRAAARQSADPASRSEPRAAISDPVP